MHAVGALFYVLTGYAYLSCAGNADLRTVGCALWCQWRAAVVVESATQSLQLGLSLRRITVTRGICHVQCARLGLDNVNIRGPLLLLVKWGKSGS